MPFQFDNPDEAIDAVAQRLRTVNVCDHQQDFSGRVLASDLRTDRDSPAADVSAMDGYAVRLADIRLDEDIPVSGQALPGGPPPPMVPGSVVKIFTGAVVPPLADAVVKREDTQESTGKIRFLQVAEKTVQGTNIRFAGENTRGGEVFLRAGTVLTAPGAAAMRNFGIESCELHDQVHVAVLTTGDEIVDQETTEIEPWQIRNSNQLALASILGRKRWLAEPTLLHAIDQPGELREVLEDALSGHDAVILTGGVSAGDHDYVPQVVRQIGGDLVFHKLPIRPGKPILAAVTGEGKLIVGLPGNPVSATMGCVRFVLPWLARISGQTPWRDMRPVVRLAEAGKKTLPLHWMRGVRLVAPGQATPVVGKGSGDLVTLAATDGFIEMPPRATGEGPWPFWQW